MKKGRCVSVMKTVKIQKKGLHKPQIVVKEKWKTQIGYYLMFAAPALCMILWNYAPMFGLSMAFVDYKPQKGIFGSEFVGLKNFVQFFGSADFVRVFRNTLAYNIVRITLINLLCGMFFALLLYEIRNKVANKIYHTCMLLPSFLSWTVVSATLLIILHPSSGLLNKLLETMGIQVVSWYREANYWPFIIVLAQIFKDAGMASIYFYSALLSVDTELFAAASLDGANRIRQIIHISLPAMSKVLCITLITGVGGVLSGTISPYYELTFDSAALYDTTLVLGTYMLNGLGGGRYSFTTAVGLTQSIIGLILVLTSNAIVKRIDSESAMF